MTIMPATSAHARGFTLIELMIVVGIIGVLAAVALPAYNDYTIRSRVAEAFVLAGEAQRAVSEYYDRWGRLPANNAAAGLARPESYQARVVEKITVNGGVVQVDLDPQVFGSSEAVAGRTRIYLRPAISRAYPTGPLAWVCNSFERGGERLSERFDIAGAVGADVVLAKYLPGTCR